MVSASPSRSPPLRLPKRVRDGGADDRGVGRVTPRSGDRVRLAAMGTTRVRVARHRRADAASRSRRARTNRYGSGVRWRRGTRRRQVALRPVGPRLRLGKSRQRPGLGQLFDTARRVWSAAATTWTCGALCGRTVTVETASARLGTAACASPGSAALQRVARPARPAICRRQPAAANGPSTARRNCVATVRRAGLCCCTAGRRAAPPAHRASPPAPTLLQLHGPQPAPGRGQRVDPLRLRRGGQPN
jgi:hypothetical protein